MNTETLRTFCLSLPDVTEAPRWESDLCFSFQGNMFCFTTEDVDSGASFKVMEEEFREMSHREGIIPAPYLAREYWVYVLEFSWLTDAEWEHYVQQSYLLVGGKVDR